MRSKTGRATAKPADNRLDKLGLLLGALACLAVLGAIGEAISLENAPKPPPPTLGPLPTFSAADLTATQDVASTASAREHTLAVTLAAHMGVTPGSVVLGVNPDGAVPAPSSAGDFVAQNVWVGLLEGNWISVYAGALRSDPQQGALILVTISPDRVDQEQFTVPLSHGALRVSAQNVQRLTLTTADGTNFYFDVLARRFVGSLITYADTATPRPSWTPTASATATATAPASASPTVTPTPTR